MDDPRKPLNDDDFDRFLQEVVDEDAAEKRAKKEREAYAEQSAQASVDTALALAGYEPLVPGTTRYEDESRRIAPFIELEVLADSYIEGTPEEIDAIVSRNVRNSIAVSYHNENRVIEATKEFLKTQILDEQSGVTKPTIERQNAEKQHTIAVLITRAFPPHGPVVSFVNIALPGDRIDIDSDRMRSYYERLRSSHEKERQQSRDQTTAILKGLIDLMRPQGDLSEEELESHLNILYDLSDDVVVTLKNNELSDAGKRNKLAILVKTSPLGPTRAQQVVDYLEENIAFL